MQNQTTNFTRTLLIALAVLLSTWAYCTDSPAETPAPTKAPELAQMEFNLKYFLTLRALMVQQSRGNLLEMEKIKARFDALDAEQQEIARQAATVDATIKDLQKRLLPVPVAEPVPEIESGE